MNAHVSDKPLLADKEFLMTERDFDEIAALALKHTGIVLGRHKANMVYGRIARRLRQTGYRNFADYLSYLKDNFRDESTNFINLITTNLTSFYREPHHFDILRDTVIPELKKKFLLLFMLMKLVEFKQLVRNKIKITIT